MMVACDELPSAKDLQIIALTERIEGMEATITEQGRQIKSFQELFSSKISSIIDDIKDIRDYFPKLIAQDRARLSALEKVPITPSDIQEQRLSKLDHVLLSRQNQPMTFSEVGKLLELGTRTGKQNTRRQAMTKFSKIIASKNDCYIISDGKTVNGKLIRLTDGYFAKLRRGRK